MESDDDTTFQLSRSWDDTEAARSILNLNSPNGFHPLNGTSLMGGSLMGGGPADFALPSAATKAAGPQPGSSVFASTES